MALVHNAAGGYRFIGAPGRPFSNGAVADAAFDLVHVTFERPLPLARGIKAAAQHVEASGRPPQAIAGFELRIARPLSRDGFDEFNRGYVAKLREIGLDVEGLMPAGRTNVAPVVGTIREPSVFGFTYTAAGSRGKPAFLLSGVPEEVEGDARTMLGNITEILAARAGELGCRLSDATAVQVYASGPIDAAALADLTAELGDASLLGFRRFLSLPPIEGLKYEIDARSAGTELTLPS